MKADNEPVLFLLAEDDEDHADLILRSMKDKDIANRIVHVTNGQQALDYLYARAPYENAERPDVILLDLKMPRVDGHEVLEQIKADPDLCRIPVVIMTTSAAKGDRVRAYSSYVNSYVLKPLDFDSFNQLVKELNFYWAGTNSPPPR